VKLNTDIRQLAAKKKAVYPTKRSMNLYFKVDRTTAPATAALYVLFAAAVLLALGKVMIYDVVMQERQLESRVLALEQRTAQQMQQLESYDQVLEDYIRSLPTQQEQEQADVMELLALIDTTIRPAAQVSQVTIADNQVVISFSGVTLAQAAELVVALEQSPLVTNTQVDTASTTGGAEQVEVHIYFQVAQEGSNP
jgi:hypothetical protein